jgi:UDP-GlcNAc:undecaprenyl-phosphate GlcNAc-1-phosphate transferase
LGLSHAQVTSFYLVIGAVQGLGAVVMVSLDETVQMLVFVPFVILQLILTIIVKRKARTQGL